jgi:hypothetical protein
MHHDFVPGNGTLMWFVTNASFDQWSVKWITFTVIHPCLSDLKLIFISFIESNFSNPRIRTACGNDFLRIAPISRLGHFHCSNHISQWSCRVKSLSEKYIIRVCSFEISIFSEMFYLLLGTHLQWRLVHYVHSLLGSNSIIIQALFITIPITKWFFYCWEKFFIYQ